MFHDSYQKQVFNTIEQVKAIKSTLLNSMNISSEEFDELMDTIHKELVEYNTYTGCTRVFAQKIMNDKQEKGVSLPSFLVFLTIFMRYLLEIFYKYST